MTTPKKEKFYLAIAESIPNEYLVPDDYFVAIFIVKYSEHNNPIIEKILFQTTSKWEYRIGQCRILIEGEKVTKSYTAAQRNLIDRVFKL